MELPFAVSEGSKSSDASSLIASSQGSLVPADSFLDDSAVIASTHSEELEPDKAPSPPELVAKPHEEEPPEIIPSNTSSNRPSSVLRSASSKVSSVISNFYKPAPKPEETIDFAYINYTDEDEVDIWLDDDHAVSQNNNNMDSESEQTKDLLGFLLQSSLQPTNDFLPILDEANRFAEEALEAKSKNNLQAALDAHTQSAKLFRQAAERMEDPNTARSLLLLCQRQTESALLLKKVVKLNPSSHNLRLTLQKALGKQAPDISESTFLGRANEAPPLASETTLEPVAPTTIVDSNDSSSNPVDEMLELEQQLRTMDMQINLGNSIATIDSRNRLKSSVMESFMVVNSTSMMMNSSSIIVGPAPPRVPHVKSKNKLTHKPPTVKGTVPPQPVQNLESSWWGNGASSTILAQSVLSPNNITGSNNPSSNQQIMRLMDSLRTLGDENANLLRQVQDADAARAEARAAREQMRDFKADYGKRFVALKEALETFRKHYPDNHNADVDLLNPVTSSEYLHSASTFETIQRQENLIKKLTNDLKKEKEVSRKKDGALRKYENFYKEVKARSAQKQRQQQLKTNR